ncbi:hypothetical protein TSA6c_08520 [Azospirillum sp. TSA6c]|uniref:hypothetical protein n=1 Tax=Azospirillum sp. TSA6c TaxID=709813 RepID=UPI000D621749|nr:hypothetical protein [Azospirillum sp. TSA6c]PWC46808.1 hypothetical protein TSA6c_08520 [Azospirillum sp. TSA6c]
MSNIVNFADYPPTNADIESRARRAETVRARANAGERFKSSADQERIAENLYRLLDRLEKDKRIRRADLCRDVLGSRPEDSTKRLAFYALNPEKEGAKRQSQLSILTQKVTKYVELAEEAAHRAGEDVDAVLLDLVHGTNLASSGSLPSEDPMTKDLKTPLIRNLERAASRVASETGLQRTYQMIARYPFRVSGSRFSEDGNINVAGPIREILVCLEDGSTSPSLESDRQDWWRLIQEAPKVLVGESILDCIKEKPQLESYSFRVEKEPFNPFASRLKRNRLQRPMGEHWSAVTEYRVRVWLALLPFGSSHEPRLGLFLQLLRHVQIEHTPAPFEPPPSLPEHASPEQMAEETLFDDRPASRVILSERILNLHHEARWSSQEEDLCVTVPANLAPLEPWLELLIGRGLYHDEGSAARVLAFSSELAQRVLDLPDCRSISDWVGPVPGVDYSGIQLEPEPPVDDHSRWDDWNNARQHAKDRDRKYRFRFVVDQEPDLPELYPMSWKQGTLGYKLERSLLEVEGEDGVLQHLRAQAEGLVAELQEKVEVALRAREERLTNLHSP